MTTYPDCDLDRSAYHAAVCYVGIEGWPTFVFPGAHGRFVDAADRARRLVDALRLAGETGAQAWVTTTGERPSGFPRMGQPLGPTMASVRPPE